MSISRKVMPPGPRALNDFVVNHHHKALKWARGFFDNPTIAEDCVQDGYMLASRAINQYDTSRPIDPWLKQIIYRVCLKKFRRKVVEVGLTEVIDATVEDFSEQVIHDLQMIADFEPIAKIMARMNQDYCWLLLAVYCEMQQRNQLQGSLQITKNALRQKIYRARVQVREYAAGESSCLALSA